MARQAFQPTPAQRKQVEALAAYGIPHDEIASVIGCAPMTLRKHFRSELDTAHAKANARVAESLFKMATEGKNVAAAIFWLKTRARWVEPKEAQPDVAPVTVVVRGERDE